MADPPRTATSPTDRTRLRRRADRGRHDRATVDAVLDAALVAHVGFVDGGVPFVLPTLHVRVGDHLYLHGAPANRMLGVVAAGGDVCVTVTLVDGLVLARSAFHHSVNYRSVVVLGKAARVDDPAEQRRVLDALVEHVVPGRTADARPPSDAELRATLLVRVPLDEASAKVRVGGPVEDPADLGLPVWAGELPLRVAAGAAIPDGASELPTPPVPGYVTGYAGPGPAPAAS